jgi:hypothetical protein
MAKGPGNGNLAGRATVTGTDGPEEFDKFEVE